MYFTALFNKIFGASVKILFLSAVFCYWVTGANAQTCATPGQDGPTNASTSINTYYPPTGAINLPAGSTSMPLSAVPPTDASGNNFGITQINAGDLLLIIQMQDATINGLNSNLYGANSAVSGADNLGGTGATSIGSSGRYEYLIATNSVPLTGGTLTFKGFGTGNGTVNSYVNAAPTTLAGKRCFQVIRVTQYSNLRLVSNISTPPFNGAVGGIIAFDVAGTMDFNGFTINASARGFRGGYSPKRIAAQNYNNLYVTTANDNRASGKGEGIAGTPRYMWDGYNEVDNIDEGLPGGSAGLGAPANAGGGGNDTNAGGGGGGNGGYGGVGGWGYELYPGSFPNGGRPGSAIYPVAVPDKTRLVMGGGGGGGHSNDSLTGVKGGVGGGIVLINAATIIGTGSILANGGAGAPGSYGGHPDGSGGGGAGGTVFVKLSSPSAAAVLDIQASGGAGGNTEGDDGVNVLFHGPGGGGGGGAVFYSIASGSTGITVLPGIAGKTNNGGLGSSNHHAENGKSGTSQSFLATDLPAYLQAQGLVCYPTLTATMAEAAPTTAKITGSTATYTIKLTNIGSGGNAGGVQADCALPAGFTYQSATVAYSGAAGGPATLTNLGTAGRPLLGNFNISPGDAVTVTLVVNIDCGMAAGTYNASVQAVYLDPTRTYTEANRRITPQVNAFAGSNTSYQATPAIAVPGTNYNGAVSANEDVIVIQGTAPANNSITQPTPDATACASSINPSLIAGTTPTGGTGTYTYQWQSSTDNINFTNITGATSKDYDPDIITTTTYFRRTVTSGNCYTPLSSNVYALILNPLGVVDNTITAPTVTSFCTSGDPGNITGNALVNGNVASYSYQWQQSANNTTFTDIIGATGVTYNTGLVSTTTYYRRQVTAGSCNTPSVSNVVTITISTGTLAKVSASQTVCFGNSVVLTASGGSTYTWAPTEGLSAANTATPTATPLITTRYKVTVTNGNCTDTASVTVTVIPQPAVDAGTDKTILKGDKVQLAGKVTGSNVSYSWVPVTYLDNPAILNPTATPTENITYTLTATSALGCFIETDKVTINVYEKLVVPNTFTPNNDGLNDTWNIAALNTYTNSLLQIYNRNGTLIFNSIGYGKQWDGSYNGKMVPFGTYYYTIDLKNGTPIMSGWVAIVK
ncbi:MAG: gliding motility-associated C-terminal domain-containing protein [Bacteroidota bacterium]